MSRLVGVVLAGGQSRRMGEDKAALSIGGETLLLRARRLLLEAGCDEVVMSGPPRAEWPHRRVEDPVAGSGPVAGIVAALRWIAAADESRAESPASTPASLHNSRLLFVAVDTPLLQPQSLRSLSEAGPDADACVFADSPLPLVLSNSPDVRARIDLAERQLRAGGSCAIRWLMDGLKVERLGVTACTDQLRNINTPDEWRKLNDELAN